MSSDLIINPPQFCYNSLIFNDLYMIFKSPVLRQKRRRKPGFSVLWILRLSLTPEFFSREDPRNSPFGEFRGHADFQVSREKSLCPPFSKRRKMPFIHHQNRIAPCPPFGFDEKTVVPDPTSQICRAFIHSETRRAGKIPSNIEKMLAIVITCAILD